MRIIKLSEIGSLFHKGIVVVHETMLKKECKKVSVGKVEQVLDDGTLDVNWDKGASRGQYRPNELVVYEPY